MKKLVLYPLFFTLSFTLIFTGCQREVEGSLPANPQPPVDQTVTASVAGRIVNEKNEPVQGAMVKTSEGVSTTTDINGQFRLENVMLNKNAGFIKVEKPGYFTGSRTFITSTVSENNVEIQLIPKTAAGSFTTNTGGNISIPNGGKIVFPQNAVINTSSNTAYTGSVAVTAYFLNPEASNFDEIMPGALRGTRSNNSEVVLQSYGMVAVELTGTSGESLQLASGKTATITFPIATSLLSSAPTNIPLWYFDEVKGLWKEEGTATKQGSNYVGTVSHFSFWNCDAPYPLIDFDATFKNQNGDPLLNAKVVITRNQNKTSISASGITDSDGRVAGKILANSDLFVEVYNKCGDVVYSKSFTTSSSSLSLGTIKVNSGSAVVSLSGTVTGCNSVPVTNGFVHIAVGGVVYRANVVNGSFSATVEVCSAGTHNATIIGYDMANNKQSDTTKLTVSTSSPSTVQINTCAYTIERFFNYTVNGTTYSIVAPADSVTYYSQGSVVTVAGYTYTNGVKKVSITCPSINGTGTVPVTNIYLALNDSAFTGQNITSMNITEYGTNANGTFISGNLSGTVKYDSIVPITHPINLSFRVKK